MADWQTLVIGLLMVVLAFLVDARDRARHASKAEGR